MARGENCLIAVAGAPTAVTNSAIAGIIDEIGQGSDIADVYGAPAGLPSVIEGKILDLGLQKRKVIEGLRRTPGSVLSGRYRPISAEEGAQLVAAFKEREIGTLFLLGGLSAVDYARSVNDAAKAADYELTVLVVPLSSDNEVASGDHNAGYGSAARFAAILARDAGRAAQGGEEPIIVLEIGGAGSGWLAAATALARDVYNSAPHTILLPEKPVNTEDMIEEVRRALHRFGYAVAVTTEGAHDLEGNNLDGAALAELLEDNLNLPARFDRLGASVRVSGANVARADADEAFALGGLVVRLAGDDFSGYVAALNRDADGKGEKGYKVIESTSRLDQVEESPRQLPAEFIAETGTGVSEAFLDWARPLIGGALPEYTALG